MKQILRCPEKTGLYFCIKKTLIAESSTLQIKKKNINVHHLIEMNFTKTYTVLELWCLRKVVANQKRQLLLA